MSSENPPNHRGTIIRVEEHHVIIWSRNIGKQKSSKDYGTGNLQYPSFTLKPSDDEALRKTDFGSQQNDGLKLYKMQLQQFLKTDPNLRLESEG
ncbi:hypothetical protein FOVG_17304 [Fusarium oxysporum f. sp. pisi HDV247]|uniref:Uncharacterized protein n=1 Tax=Fusarium oxysporum f. sp. pisi HDV247 TaxID=1080344 RepID=W9NN59_FUSOX|nr:hypothetical protein FOVG_17304 [Fusarium oxysporum f. sp. pisi HDV247]